MKKSFFLLAIAFVFSAFWFYFSYLSALDYSLDPESSDQVLIDIKKGSNADQIASLLHEKKLIESPFFFKLYLKQENLSNQIKAGRLILKESDDLKKITEALVDGKTASMPVTLLEGWTAQQIADYLESIDLTTADEFMDCFKNCSFETDFIEFISERSLEGFLYPDTYFVDYSQYSDQAFIQRLIDTFQSKLADDWEAIENNKYSLQEVVIMASIVEREERNEKEQATVAGVLWNRFDNGIGLGADATVLYALGRTKGGLSYNDLQIDSPYNTRKYRGLPPGPISNPGLSSIRAALYPKKTNYFYYLHDSNGQVYYAETLEGHNANKRKYILN